MTNNEFKENFKSHSNRLHDDVRSLLEFTYVLIYVPVLSRPYYLNIIEDKLTKLMDNIKIMRSKVED